MDYLEKFLVRGNTIKIYQDEYPENPREWDNLGTMICFHSRYMLGDKHDLSIEALKELVSRRDILALPLYLLDHSGLALNTSGFAYIDPQGWDWDQVGYLYVTHEKLRQEYGVKKVSRRLLEKVKQILEAEIETYNQYLSGDVYGYEIEDPYDNEGDSCWGFYGLEAVQEAARKAIEYE